MHVDGYLKPQSTQGKQNATLARELNRANCMRVRRVGAQEQTYLVDVLVLNGLVPDDRFSHLRFQIKTFFYTRHFRDIIKDLSGQGRRTINLKLVFIFAKVVVLVVVVCDLKEAINLRQIWTRLQNKTLPSIIVYGKLACN